MIVNVICVLLLVAVAVWFEVMSKIIDIRYRRKLADRWVADLENQLGKKI